MLTFLRQLIRGFVLVALCTALVPIVSVGAVVGALILLPLPATLPQPNATMPSQATKIFDVHGELIGELQTFDTNIPVDEADIPLVLKQAVISSEDRSFYKHDGIDIRGTGRALWADIRNKKVTQGGSTITQQYVKLAFTNREQTLVRKIREAILASQLDRQVDKDEILYRYLSAVYFGDGTYGIGAAAQSYFHKSVNQLSISECATLVGVIPAPTAWAPRQNPTVAESRRHVVLQKMLQEGYITQQQYEEARAQKIWLESQGAPNGPVTMVYNMKTGSWRYPYYVDYVKRYLQQKYGAEVAQRGGLRVQTSLDQTLQQQAEQAVSDRLNGTSAPLDMSLVSVEPQTGFVRALVGGRDFSVSSVNLALGNCPAVPPKSAKVVVRAACWDSPMVTGGGSGRQPGSSFKPFVLASAYEQGMQPGKIYPAPPMIMLPNCRPTSKENNCQVHNAEGESYGPTSIKEALAHSFNTVYVPLARDVGFKNVGEMTKRLGLDDFYYSPTMHGETGNWVLGSTETSPLEMASAYGVFANHGLRLPPTPVVKILDAKGKTVEDNSQRKGEQVISESVADNVTDALEGVIDHGTGNPNAEIGRPAAGKTGTTEDFHDAWFVGYTPTLSTSVWMGNAKSGATSINYKGNTRVYGGSIPALTWAQYMRSALSRVVVTNFRDPAPIERVNTNVITAEAPVTTIDVLRPQQVRQPAGTPGGTYDQTQQGNVRVQAPDNSPATPTAPTSATTAPPAKKD